MLRCILGSSKPIMMMMMMVVVMVMMVMMLMMMMISQWPKIATYPESGMEPLAAQ